jgi:hypothetical protein
MLESSLAYIAFVFGVLLELGRAVYGRLSMFAWFCSAVVCAYDLMSLDFALLLLGLTSTLLLHWF